MAIVVTVSEHAGTPEQAEQAIRQVVSRYEGKNFVFAADNLRDLPHPAQITETRKYFDSEGLLGDSPSQWTPVQIEGLGSYVAHLNMPLPKQTDMLRDYLTTELNWNAAQVNRAIDQFTEAYSQQKKQQQQN